MSGAIVRWNGESRTTSFVGPTQLTAQITATDLAVAGVERLAAQQGKIVGREGRGDDLAVVQRGVGLQRAVHRRNGDGLAAEQVEDGIEKAHGFAPQ